MGWLTLEQFVSLVEGQKCSVCNGRATWFANKNSLAYCDEHYPYKEIDKEKENDSEHRHC